MRDTLSISEAVRHIFPYMNPATIHQWMIKGVFVPETYVSKPAGRGHGCRLSIADLVTIGILHSLFTFGATFRAIQDSGEIIQENPMHFEGLGIAWIPYKQDEFISQGRPIQRWLEQIGYDSLILYQPTHVRIPLRDAKTVKFRLQANIIFFPNAEEYVLYLNRFRRTQWGPRRNMPAAGKVRHTTHTVGYAYVNIRDWYEVVHEGLKSR